ncbi:bifunctional 2-polyprenyl-6-hydroxyphenol methylase/3-demethylubiquinol 3-O-methyltransferase UbiG [Pedobacter sp. SYP-B3415]|uniref:class I SAM-dependent methyltransferase n=1 Tax=Pedobacter sp. SYP-B3415 TaxID=2496641 RepID=UPI00101BCBE4|nr:class I SAM-dependent methyltransferase [Pedobacter sp. SYP-B3415]
MKENKYDNAAFFEAYSEMPRSKQGLTATGEWEALQKMLPGLKGKSVLDLGCGYGWHCIYAAEQGASRVVGIDLSEKMIAVAKSKSKDLPITYIQTAIEDFDRESSSFDVVFSSLALHYLPELDTTFKQVWNLLNDGGEFIFSMEHLVFTAREEQDWFKDEHGEVLHWPLDNYQDEGIRKTSFLGHEVVKYHRTLESILNGLLKTGFNIQAISEPKPPLHMLERDPALVHELRRPIFLMVRSRKASI